MILPMVASLCDDALRAVPHSLRRGAYALGATSYETTTRVVVPGAFSGVMAAFVLAMSRALGETMAVTLAAGATPRLTANPLESIQTMTAYIVQVSLGDTPAGTIEYQTIFAVGALLFVITLGANVVANRVMNHFREVYE
jgi:phosphate transport system permease protein